MQVLTVVDTSAPVLTTPADVTIECDAPSDPSATGLATATDGCDGAPVVSFSDATAPGSCAQEQVIQRTWTATDGCGNSASAVQVVTVVDTSAPVVTMPADVTVECGDSTDPADTGAATATDGCDGAPSVSFTDIVLPSGCAQEHVIERSWTATDGCGNSTEVVQFITVVDTTEPVLTLPADIAIECQEPSDPANTGAATASDGCDAAPVLSHSDTIVPGASPLEDVIEREWSATDGCGNSVSGVQLITVEVRPWSFAVYSGGHHVHLHKDALVEGDVFSGGKLDLHGQASIVGLAFATGDVHIHSGAAITDGFYADGKVKNQGSATDLGPVPGGLPVLSAFDTSSYDAQLALAKAEPKGNVKTSSLDLAGGTLLIDGKFELKNGGSLLGPGTIVATGDIKIGDGATVGAGVTLISGKSVRFGKGCQLGAGGLVYAEKDVELKDAAAVFTHVLAGGKVEIHKRATVGGLVFGMDHVHIHQEATVSGSVISLNHVHIDKDAVVGHECSSFTDWPLGL